MRTMTEEVVKGDIVQIKRGWDSHWGVCVGYNEMVHLAPDVISNGREQNALVLNNFTGDEKARIVKSKISVVAGENEYCANNYLDIKYQPKPVKDIVSFALEQVERCSWGYSLVFSNGEKFAIWCRYRNDCMGGRAPSWAVLMVLRLLVLFKIIIAVFASILLLLILILNKMDLAHDTASQGTTITLVLLNSCGVAIVPKILFETKISICFSFGIAWGSVVGYMAMNALVDTASLFTIMVIAVAAPVSVGHLVTWNLRASTFSMSLRSVTTLSPTRSIQTALSTTTALIFGIMFGLVFAPYFGSVISIATGVCLSVTIGFLLWTERRASVILVLGTALGTGVGAVVALTVWPIDCLFGANKQWFPSRFKEAIAVGTILGTIVEIIMWSAACYVGQDAAQF